MKYKEKLELDNGAQISGLGVCEDSAGIHKQRSTERNRLSVGYKDICFEYAQFKVLEGLPNLDVQYADLCVGLLSRRRWMLRREFANHFNIN